MATNKWAGFRFPTRQLTDEEREIFSPDCHKCSLPARVVEAQYPLSKAEERQPLAEFTNEALKFYCAMHSPMELPDEAFEDSVMDLYRQLKTQIFCPKREHYKICVTCVRLQPRCIRKCEPIKGILGDVPLKLAKEICDKGFDFDKAQRLAKKKDGEDT